jgi:hypothetical protein
MTPDAKSPRPGGGSGDHGMSSFSGEDFPDSPSRQKDQARILVRRSGVRAPLHLVPKAAPPRPRRIEVQISIRDDRCPIGMTRPLRITEADAAALIEAAERLEAGHV